MSPDGSIKPPPEEKLLRLIRAKPSVKPAAPEGPAAAWPTMGAAMDLPFAAGGRAARRQLPWPKVAVAALSIALGVEGLWLLVQLVRPLPPVGLPAVQDAQIQDGASAEAPEALPSLAASAQRPLFASSGGSNIAPATDYRMPSGMAKGLTSRLSLTGIVSGEPPQAIIEDSETKKTYFVTAGQPIVEGAVLEQVLDNRVVLSLDGERIELSL